MIPYIPIFLNIVGFLYKVFGASDKTLKEYEALVREANEQGSISVETRDKLLSQKDVIKLRNQK